MNPAPVAASPGAAAGVEGAETRAPAVRRAARWVLAIAALGPGCRGPGEGRPVGPEPPAPVAAARARSAEQVQDAVISGILDAPVTLRNGVFEGEPFVQGGAARPRLLLLDRLVAFGEVDGAPGDEAVALLAETTGGSGERIHLTVIGPRDGAAASLATTLVGDRVRLRSLSLSGRDIRLDVVEHDAGEPACCPTRLARRTYVLEHGALALRGSEGQGTLSLGALAGRQWTVIAIDDRPLTVAEGGAPTATFEAGRIGGSSGCNRYSATIRESASGEVVLGPIAGTRMACGEPQMEVERRFLAALEGVTRYAFAAGALALTGAGGAGGHSLLLIDRAAAGDPLASGEARP